MDKARQHKLVNLFALLVLALLSLALLANSMTKPLSRDEQMYCTAGYLLGKGLLVYRDFSYVAQMPYHPLLYAALFRFTGTTHYLLAARLLSVFFDILITLCLVGIFRRIFRPYVLSGTLLGLAGAALFVFNPFVGYLLGFAWNHDAVLFCVVLSFLLFLPADSAGKIAILRIAAIAVLLTIAVWMRITTVLALLLFFAMLIIKSADSLRERLIRALVFAIVVVIFSLWPVWVILQQPRAFFVNAFLIPVLNGGLLHRLGLVYDKFYLTLIALTDADSVFLLLVAVYVWLCVFFLRRRIIFTNTLNTVFSLLMPACFFIIAYIPSTIWIQYWGVPVIFVIITLAFGMRYLRTIQVGQGKAGIHFQISSVVILAIVLTAAVRQNPVENIRRFLKINNWTPIQTHKISQHIVAKSKGSKLILTLSPLYVIEGGGTIYNQFSAGPFAYRVADELSESDRVITRTAGLAELDELMKNNPPDAIVIGPELNLYEIQEFISIVPPNWQTKHLGRYGAFAYPSEP